MAEVGTYLNFRRETEEAFLFYRSVFGGEFEGPGIMRMGDNPAPEGAPELSEEDKALVMNVGLRITGGHLLMGTDSPDSFGYSLNVGNNSYLNLMPDSRSESDRLFAGLSEGGRIESPMAEMFWGAYWGSCVDRFGVQWMVNCYAPAGT
jgi:PhnB protein